MKKTNNVKSFGEFNENLNNPHPEEILTPEQIKNGLKPQNFIKMKNLKVVKIENDELVFNDGTRLLSNHDQDCCEHHYLDFADLDISDFDGLEFDLTSDDFFNRVEDYGIELKPIKGHVVRVPGYGSNNGNYGSNIDLIIADANGKTIKSYDVSECQKVDDY